MAEKIRFCKRCLLPETYPNIQIGQDGICNVCRQYDERWKNWNPEKAKKDLKKKVEKIKNSKKKVVVTCSGGLDSTYVMLICKKEYDLDIVGANFNHGFVTDTARRNLTKIQEKLNVPIITIEPDMDVMYSLYRDFLVNTGDFCTPCCQGCSRSGFLVARQYNTNIIIHGGVSGSRVEFNVLGMLRHHYSRFMKHGGKNYPPSALYKIATPTEEISQFELISLPYYFEWNEKKIIETIKRELHWEPLPNGRTRHIDCLVAEVSDYLLQKKFGFSKRWMTVSANIRAGFISKKEGLKMIIEQEEALSEEPPAMNLFLEKLKITREELYALPFYKATPAVRFLKEMGK